MISEFLWLDLIDRNNNSLHFSCSLPDPDPDGEEKMVQCGDVFFTVPNAIADAAITIRLFDNFSYLCIGDSYQRKDFVQTLVFIISTHFNVVFSDVYVDLIDSWGTYSGKLDLIDSILRSVG